jgi:hypothetical protein
MEHMNHYFAASTFLKGLSHICYLSVFKSRKAHFNAPKVSALLTLLRQRCSFVNLSDRLILSPFLTSFISNFETTRFLVSMLW